MRVRVFANHELPCGANRLSAITVTIFILLMLLVSLMLVPGGGSPTDTTLSNKLSNSPLNEINTISTKQIVGLSFGATIRKTNSLYIQYSPKLAVERAGVRVALVWVTCGKSQQGTRKQAESMSAKQTYCGLI
ncbi:hypothetical protein Tco_0489093 [Tanacetum coccineum]